MDLSPLRRLLAAVLGLFVVVSSVATAAPGPSRAELAGSSRPARTACDLPAGDPDPAKDPDAWRARDRQNTECARQRDADQQGNPAYQAARDAAAQRMFQEAMQDQLAHPTRPRATAPYLLPRNYYPGDPFRLPEDWAASGRGRLRRVSFVASSGSHLRGALFAPRTARGLLPAVVFTTGSLQGFQDAYNSFFEGLAEEGYLVLAYDVQGQGRSESAPHDAAGRPTCCRGVPFQQNENFFQGTRDALTFLFSTPARPHRTDIAAARGANSEGTDSHNPWWQRLDRTRVGIAGHSRGAHAVGQVAQEDRRVKAVVGFDTLHPLPAGLRPHAPALSITAENLFGAGDPANPPDPETNGSLEDGHLPREAYDELVRAGVDAGLITQRSSQHNESSYASSAASRYGERTAFYWTLAWFDRYLKGDRRATSRLMARTMDGSADRSSIGAGTYDQTTASNVPYRIAGDCVASRVSIYFRSSLWLERGRHQVRNLRARGCPAAAR